MNKKNIKCVDDRIVYKINSDDPYGFTTCTVTYDDGYTEVFRTFTVPAEIELFCGKAYVDETETVNECERVVYRHYEGKRPCFY